MSKGAIARSRVALAQAVRARPVAKNRRAGRRDSPREPPVSLARHLETLASVGGLTGLLGALLYYFGWARASSTYAYFGLGVEMLDLSFQDYLLRSVRLAYWPLILVGLIGLAASPVNGLIARSRMARAVGLILAGLGTLGILVGVAAVLRWITFRTQLPVVATVLLGGTLLVVYASRLLGHVHSEPSGISGLGVAVRRGLIVAIVVLLAFWTVSNYAGYQGLRIATAIADDLTGRTGVVVYSEKNLHLRGSGIVVRTIGDDNSAYRFCHAGLRLLIHSGDRHVLLPERWQRGRDPVTVLGDDGGLRFEYVRTTEPTTCP